MGNELIIAICASFTSLIVALISLLSSTKSSKLLSKLEKNKKAWQIEDKILTKRIKALDVMIQNIQKIKDTIYLILNSPDDYFDSLTAVGNIKSDKEMVFKNYEKYSSDFNLTEDKAAHIAKEKSHILEKIIVNSLKDFKYVSLIDDKIKDKLKNFRIEFSELQDTLRDNKLTLISKRISKLD